MKIRARNEVATIRVSEEVNVLLRFYAGDLRFHSVELYFCDDDDFYDETLVEDENRQLRDVILKGNQAYAAEATNYPVHKWG